MNAPPSALGSWAASASECFLELKSLRSPWETEQTVVSKGITSDAGSNCGTHMNEQDGLFNFCHFFERHRYPLLNRRIRKGRIRRWNKELRCLERTMSRRSKGASLGDTVFASVQPPIMTEQWIDFSTRKIYNVGGNGSGRPPWEANPRICGCCTERKLKHYTHLVLEIHIAVLSKRRGGGAEEYGVA